MKQQANLQHKKQHKRQHKKHQQGFTLLELLVVVSVLATLAGITAVAMDGYEQQSQEQLVEVEMQRIASAIYRFKEDTGYFPEEGVFSDEGNDADFSWLFNSPRSGGNEILPWNINTGRGWHGPYLDISSQESVVVNSTICGLNAANFNTGFSGNELQGLTDTFERDSDINTESCVGIRSGGEWVKREFSGQVYRYQASFTSGDVADCPTSGNGCLALVSAGVDSQLNTSDDLVYVLRVNP